MPFRSFSKGPFHKQGKSTIFLILKEQLQFPLLPSVSFKEGVKGIERTLGLESQSPNEEEVAPWTISD